MENFQIHHYILQLHFYTNVLKNIYIYIRKSHLPICEKKNATICTNQKETTAVLYNIYKNI